MTGIWIARRYWLFSYIEEPIYSSVYHVFGGQDYFLQASFFVASSYSFLTSTALPFHSKNVKGSASAEIGTLDILRISRPSRLGDMDLTNISPMSPLSIIRLIAFHWTFNTASYLAGLCPTPRRLSGSDSCKFKFFICDQFFFLNLAYLLCKNKFF